MSDRARVFPEAQTVLRMFMQELDQQAPGLIPDAYIAGSLALDDARPGQSDIDLVLVLRDGGSVDDAMLALRSAMDLLCTTYPEPIVDGIVVTRDDLMSGPANMEGPRPVISEGHLELSEEGSARNPVTWQTLRQGGITWRGVPVAELDLHRDDDLLHTWTRDNLRRYWQPWLGKSDRLLSRFGRWSLRPDFIEWGVLGVTRLHYTIATGEITSKSGAGEYALETFPDYWHKIVQEALDIRDNPDRATSLYRRDVLGRRKEARDYVAMVIEDALAR